MNIYDISQKAGVSIATVSRVLNDSPHVSGRTRDKVLAVIEGCGYVPNAFARSLGLNTMKTIGLVCPNAADPYLSQALAHLERAFRENLYDCVLACTGRPMEARAGGVERMANRHVDGMVLMGSSFIGDTDAENAYIRSAAKRVPVVLLNGSFHCENVYSVLCDDRRATMEAAQYLADTGRRRILYLYHSRNSSGRRKLAGYRDGLSSRGIPMDEERIEFLPEDGVSVPEVRDHLLRLHEKGVEFDAVLSSEDILSVGAEKYARVVNRRVPEDLSIIGYNNSGLCLCCEPELTSVDNRLKALCDHCVATMLGVLGGEEMPGKTVFDGKLVRRGSTL